MPLFSTGRCFAARQLFAFALAVAPIVIPRLGADASAIAAPVPIVRTSAGAVSGTLLQNMAAYRGIPYAAPPVGALRWQPPHPHAPWSGIRTAKAFANHCPQIAGPFGLPSVTEDCLYLNVFAPAGTPPGAKLPVLVWIHGGSFVDGESDDYDPDRLVARGTVVVTLNYRLGYLGLLATSGLDAEPHTHANYGLLDQQYALAWTRANIGAFGGDAARVTVAGQSAGGAGVFAQLVSPGSAGLFSRAIVQSGAYDVLSLPTLAAAETAGNALAAATGCPPANAACLRGLSVTQILLAQQQAATVQAPLTGGPSPAIDGTMIPQAPEDALAFGKYNHVPVLQGTDSDEFRLFTALLFDLSGGALTPAEYPVAVQQTLTAAGLGAFTGAVLNHYPLKNYASPDLAYSALGSDAVFATPAYLTDLLLSARTPVYAYEFADVHAPEGFLPPVTFPYAAAHGSELQFIYDSFDRVSPPLSSDERTLAATMVRYWTDFAAHGTPNTFGTPFWPPYDGFADDLESLTPPRPNVFLSFVPEHNVVFWAALAAASQLPNSAPGKHYLTLESAQRASHALHRGTPRP